MWVAIDSVSARARVVLHFSGGPELEVLGLAGAATATFRPREDGISVAQLRGGELRINVPRQTSSFSLLVRGVEVAGAAAGRFRGGGSDSLVIVARP